MSFQTNNKILFSILSLITLFSLNVQAVEVSRRTESFTKALYGFSKNHSLVKGKSDYEIITWLKQMGFNAVFGGYKDKKFVTALHENGFKVYAEYSIFVGEKYWKRYPHSRPITAEGKPQTKQKWYAGVNPVCEEIRAEKLKGIQKLINETPVDGIWLDFIRWPCHWEVAKPKLEQTSFDKLTLTKFISELKLPIVLNSKVPYDLSKEILIDYLALWPDWKCRQITSFVADVKAIVKSSKRKIFLGAFTVPWTANDYNGAIRSIIGQDYKALGQYLDIISPMAYHAMCGQLPEWVGEVTTWAAQKSSAEILPIMQIVDEPNPITPQEIRKILQGALMAEGSNGVIVFNMRALDDAKAQAIKNIFTTHQTPKAIKSK
jgi:uncharacterized lipoprotein YddW (UPF0748 family)